MNNVLALIERAMKENLTIKLFNLRLEIYNKDKKIYINPLYNIETRKYEVVAITSNNGNIEFSITEKELLKYKLMLSEVEDYVVKRGTEDFANFFNETDSSSVDLDDEDD